MVTVVVLVCVASIGGSGMDEILWSLDLVFLKCGVQEVCVWVGRELRLWRLVVCGSIGLPASVDRTGGSGEQKGFRKVGAVHALREKFPNPLPYRNTRSLQVPQGWFVRSDHTFLRQRPTTRSSQLLLPVALRQSSGWFRVVEITCLLWVL